MEQRCPACGADNVESARYCRKCGVQLGSSQFNEAPTRNFDDQRQPMPDHMSGPALGFQESPRYAPPMPAQPPTGYQPHPAVTGVPQRISTAPITTGPVRKKGAPWLLIIGGVFLMFVLCIAALVAFIASRVHVNSTSGDKGTPVAAKKGDDGGFGGSVTGPTDPDDLPKALKGWYYPDADVDNVVSGSLGSMEGGVLIMRSDDDADDIADYYREKFKGFKGKQQEVRSEDKIVFTGDGATVVVEPDENHTDQRRIIATVGGPNGIPAGIPIDIPTPVIPAPPPPPPAPGVSAPAPDAKKDKTPEPSKPDAKAPKASTAKPGQNP